MSPTPIPNRGRWIIDKHIPVAVLLTLLMQTAGVVYLTTRFMTATELRLTMLETQVQSLGDVNVRLVKLETVTTHNAQTLQEIHHYLISGEK